MTIKWSMIGVGTLFVIPLEKWSAVVSMAAGLVTPPPPMSPQCPPVPVSHPLVTAPVPARAHPQWPQ